MFRFSILQTVTAEYWSYHCLYLKEKHGLDEYFAFTVQLNFVHHLEAAMYFVCAVAYRDRKCENSLEASGGRKCNVMVCKWNAIPQPCHAALRVFQTKHPSWVRRWNMLMTEWTTALYQLDPYTTWLNLDSRFVFSCCWPKLEHIMVDLPLLLCLSLDLNDIQPYARSPLTIWTVASQYEVNRLSNNIS